MAGGPANFKEELEMPMADDPGAGSLGQSQEQPMIPEIVERGTRLLGASQRRPRMEPKATGSATGQPSWTLTGSRPKKGGHQLQLSRMLREQIHADAHPQEYPSSFQCTRFSYECSPDADMVAEMGLEEFNGLEMEVMRRQMHVIAGRLRALENQGTFWYHKETILFILLVANCFANLWLWMRL